jgi:hypothetical protein
MSGEQVGYYTPPWTRAGATPLFAAVFGVATAIFAVYQIHLWGKNGLWLDEVYSLFGSDPDVAFPKLLFERILPETNPPGYPSLLHFMRLAVEPPREAMLVLNLAGLALACAYVLTRARAAGVLPIGLAACAVVVLSGPVLCYAQEGRAYLLAMCVAFVIAWDVALAVSPDVEDSVRRRLLPSLAGWAAFGCGAALLHAYGALFAGAAGAALLAEGLMRRDGKLAASGLALGASTSIVFAAWFVLALPHMSNVAWLEFTPEAIYAAAWQVKALAIGSGPFSYLIAALFVLLLALAARDAALRPLMRAFGIVAALFIVLPLLASLITPVMHGRYYLIGLPAFFLVLVWTLFRLAPAALSWRPADGFDRSAAAAGSGLLALLGALVLGGRNAEELIVAKPVWRGAAHVEAARDCAPGTVRIGGDPRVIGRPELYGAISGQPAGTFVHADSESAPMAVAEAPCPVIGWYEHLEPADAYSEQELMALLAITGDPASIRFVRHPTGFVAVRAE